MNKQRFSFICGISLIVIGLALAVNPTLEYWRSKHVEHVATSPFSVVASATPAFPQQPVVFKGEPVRLQIPALKIDLNVIDGYYNKNSKTWTLTKDMAQYATITPQPNNQEGNTFIYGHNRPGVFNTLSKIAVGDEAIITTDNGHVFTYRFRTAYETNPNDNSLFQYTGAPILTVQTCSGVWYQNRQLFTFDLVKAQ
jgi:LPXTG-site transpeptidase (sortase) family protein